MQCLLRRRRGACLGHRRGHTAAARSSRHPVVVVASRSELHETRACPSIHSLPRRTKSRYNPAAESTQVSDIRPARLLGGNTGAADGAERTEAQAMIQRCDQVRSMLTGPLHACNASRGAK